MVCAYPTVSGRNVNINRNRNININSIKDTIKNEVVNINEQEVVPIPEPEPTPEPCEPEIPVVIPEDDCEHEVPIVIPEDDCEEEHIPEPEVDDCEDDYKTASHGVKKMEKDIKKKSAIPVQVEDTKEVKAAKAVFFRAFNAARLANKEARAAAKSRKSKSA